MEEGLGEDYDDDDDDDADDDSANDDDSSGGGGAPKGSKQAKAKKGNKRKSTFADADEFAALLDGDDGQFGSRQSQHQFEAWSAQSDAAQQRDRRVQRSKRRGGGQAGRPNKRRK